MGSNSLGACVTYQIYNKNNNIENKKKKKKIKLNHVQSFQSLLWFSRRIGKKFRKMLQRH